MAVVSFILLFFNILLNSSVKFLISLNFFLIIGSLKSSPLNFLKSAFSYSIFYISSSKLDKFFISYNWFISSNYLSNYS